MKDTLNLKEISTLRFRGCGVSAAQRSFKSQGKGSNPAAATGELTEDQTVLHRHLCYSGRASRLGDGSCFENSRAYVNKP